MKSFFLLFFVVIYGVMGLPNYRETRVLPPSSLLSSMRSKQSVISVSVSENEKNEKEETGGGGGGGGGGGEEEKEPEEEAENLLRGNINSDETILKYKNIPTSTKIKPTTIPTTTFAALTETKKVTNSKNSDDPNGIKETRESLGKIRPQLKITTNYTSASETGVKLPEGASAALAKPTKYHYYPHNQHIYLLPECAVQQVCNAVYVRLNFTQPLCACPGRYRDPCSASLDSDDHHTTELVTDPRTKALTLVKTCEPVADMRECRAPKDWSLLALQNVRTGKSHYLVICRCPDTNILEGPMSHDQPMYASVPGIRVYGMMCVQGNRRGRPLRYTRSLLDLEEREKNSKPSFPWHKVPELMKIAAL